MLSWAPIQLLVLQSTPFCNLDCSYCYLPDRTNRSQMTEETLGAIGRVVVGSPSFSDETTVVWHAGEPCVLSPEWYRRAKAILESSSERQVLHQSFQTNGTLINDAWIGFLKDESIQIGVSLDGPREIHDLRRRTRAGKGTYEQTMAGIARLRQADIPFHIIAVISEATLSAPEALARTIVETGAHTVGLNVEEIDGTNKCSSLYDSEMVPDFGMFIQRFHEELEKTPNAPKFREYEGFRDYLEHGARIGNPRNQENSPYAIISIGSTGDVSTFSPELLGLNSQSHNNFSFGNVGKLYDITQIGLHPAFRRTYREISDGVRRCYRDCEYFPACGGGSPSNKLGELGRFDGTATRFCDLMVKKMYDTFLDNELRSY